MRAVLLTIGDELLIGQVVDSNAAWLGEQLSLSGIDVTRTVTVGDDLVELERELARALDESDLVVTTGGLGPTHDDVTREAIAEVYGVDLEFHPGTFDRIRRRFESRGRRMPDSNRAQAMVPAGFAVLPNPAGTAPGLWREGVRSVNGRAMLAVLPGVPHEMKRLFRDEVQPRVLERGNVRMIEHRTLRTAGIGESNLQDAIGDLSDVLQDTLRLAYLPSTTGVRLRLTAFGKSGSDVHAHLQEFEGILRERIGRFIYGTENESLEGVVGRLLRERNLTIAVAESCTGGYVAHTITNVSGSSSYMLGGVIAYSNRIKTELLGVDPEVLEGDGAVSEAVARQMAAGIREHMDADIGVSTTGIAGPTGGTSEKPVGTVWIGYADRSRVEARLLRLVEERLLNKELTTTLLLDHVRRNVLKIST
ncbi:MAG: competence/damage-inducible protein A [Rhodothermales bacterium]